MQLRAFRAADLEILYEIDQSCFPPGVSYSREELAGFIAHRNSETWVGEEGDRIVAFLVAGREPQGVGHIITIDVIAEWRRRGAGKALMGVAEDWARGQGLKLIYLETAEDNLAAQRFYQAHGYTKLKRIDRYYANGAAAWVMVKWLKQKSRV